MRFCSFAIILLISNALVLSCKDQDKDVLTVRNILGKTICLPNILYTLSQKQQDEIDQALLKIVSYIDGDCSVCVIQLSFWADFANKLSMLGYNVPILVYISTSNEEYVIKIIEKIGCEKISWTFDHEKEFIFNNKLLNPTLQTIMIDSNNNVVDVGNPVLSEKRSMSYLKKIKKITQTH